ncbi:RLA class II histocompatibility antigen, DP alpha-1 chain-like [Latimeria chalumnae]|uniref:RLA class II histocompatibility antigen, DP alpha-1 chain-like n=1 Tax=Latimeria chalumnae TaxID=7897 RepID=UPI00313D4EB4
MLDNEEAFSVDLEKKETVWRLPQFKDLANVEAAGALRFMQVCKNPPDVRVYPEDQVEFGKSNILICFMDNFFPPVLNVSWYRNGELVSEGVSDTDFYHKTNYRFRRFSYLVFTPEVGDIYSCHVEHWGLEEPLNKFWEPDEPPSTSEVTGTVVCAFGLALGLIGVAIGTILLIKGMKRNQNTRRMHRGDPVVILQSLPDEEKLSKMSEILQSPALAVLLFFLISVACVSVCVCLSMSVFVSLPHCL